MTTDAKIIQEKIMTGEINPNRTESFFDGCIKAALLWMNDHISLKGRKIPHFIMNTGDEVMYRELMNYYYDRGQGVTDEDFVYNRVPRCVVSPGAMNTLPDQLTQPYSRGVFEIEVDDSLYEFSAETRRLPIQISLSLKYIIDSFSDCLDLTQSFFTELLYIQTFKFVYMGETVICSLKMPDGVDVEKLSTVEFGTEGRFKTINIELTLDTNIPVYDPRTAVSTDRIITKVDNNIGRDNGDIDDDIYVKRKYEINPVEDGGEDNSEDDIPDYIKKAELC